MQVTGVCNMRAGVRECAGGGVCERADSVCERADSVCGTCRSCVQECAYSVCGTCLWHV